jgi:hypothetical protein
MLAQRKDISAGRSNTLYFRLRRRCRNSGRSFNRALPLSETTVETLSRKVQLLDDQSGHGLKTLKNTRTGQTLCAEPL